MKWTSFVSHDTHIFGFISLWRMGVASAGSEESVKVRVSRVLYQRPISISRVPTLTSAASPWLILVLSVSASRLVYTRFYRSSHGRSMLRAACASVHRGTPATGEAHLVACALLAASEG